MPKKVGYWAGICSRTSGTWNNKIVWVVHSGKVLSVFKKDPESHGSYHCLTKFLVTPKKEQ
jgi:hypothetical protein